MDTPHLSEDDENQLQDDMTLVDGNSSGGEDQTDNIQDDLETLTSSENMEGNNDKSEDISLTGLNAMSNVPEDGLWESDNLFKDLPYEEKNLCDKGSVSPTKEVLATDQKSLNDIPVSSSEAIPIPSLSPQLPVTDNSHSLLPKITLKGVCSKPSLSTTPIVLNAVNSNDSPYVVNKDNQAKSIIMKASEARSMLEANNNKPTKSAPQLVYVKPPLGAKIINPNQSQSSEIQQLNNNQLKPIILPANTIPGQTKQLVLQQSGNSPPVLIPVGSVIQSGSNVIPVTQTNNGTILVPSTANKNILVPVSATSSFKATTPSFGTQIVYSGLPSSQSNTILLPANQSVKSNTIMIPHTNKKILPTLIPNQKIVLPNGSANNPYIIVPTSGTGYKPGDKILVKTTTKTLTQKAPMKIVPKTAPAFNPKPGQLVLQTADGQKLLLQPIEGSKADPILAPQKLVFHQGRVDPASVPKTTFLPVKQSPSPVVAYTTASTPKGSDSNTTITGGELKACGIRKDMLTSIPTSLGSLDGEKQHMRLKINVENSKGEVKETIEKDVELDTASLVKKKSVLVDILTNQKEAENKNKEVDDDIAVFEIRKDSQDLIDKQKLTLSKKTIDNNPKIPSSTGIGGMSYFKKTASKDAGEVSCFVPLDVCGSETLDHLISLAQNPPSSPSELETFVNQRVSSPQPQLSVKTLLKNALQKFPSKQINVNNSNRRKQDLTNRNADMDLAIIKPNTLKPKPKKRSAKRPTARRRSTVEQDEVISSITDFDLVHLQREFESNEEIDVVNSPSGNDNEMDFEIKQEQLSPEVDNSVPVDDSTIRIKRERDDDDDEEYMASCSKNIKAEPNDKPTCYGQSGVLSSEDLVRRSFRIYDNPSHKSVHIEPDSSRSKSNTFIPFTNFLSDSPAVKLENVEDFDAYASFDYSNTPGPISVSIKKGKKKIRALMGLKDLYIRDCPDFRVIESRFAINCKRNVYSCNQCDGEYCTINIKSLADHLVMHQKFPKIHQLVSERPYEVSGLSGKEVSDMVAGTERTIDGYDLNQYLKQSANKFPNNDKKYVCHLCPYNGKNTAAMQSHLNVHKMTSRVSCNICNVVYRNRKVVEIHQANEHGIMPPDGGLTSNDFYLKPFIPSSTSNKQSTSSTESLVYVSARPL